MTRFKKLTLKLTAIHATASVMVALLFSYNFRVGAPGRLGTTVTMLLNYSIVWLIQPLGTTIDLLEKAGIRAPGSLLFGMVAVVHNSFLVAATIAALWIAVTRRRGTPTTT